MGNVINLGVGNTVPGVPSGAVRKHPARRVYQAAAFGDAPHQSAIGSEEPMADSFSPRGEAFVRHPTCSILWHRVETTTQGFSLEGEAVMKSPKAIS